MFRAVFLCFYFPIRVFEAKNYYEDVIILVDGWSGYDCNTAK